MFCSLNSVKVEKGGPRVACRPLKQIVAKGIRAIQFEG
jgi:hypothetical protein